MAQEAHNITAAFLAVDRRSEPRSASVYRPVIIETDGYTGFCLIRNISDGGMNGLVYADLSEGLPITVQFPTGLEVGGTIVWSKDQTIGVEFNSRIDSEQLLKELGSARLGEKVNRAPRISIEKPIILVARDKHQVVTLHDISQRGAKVAAPALDLGEDVVLQLEGMQPSSAKVRWLQGGAAGLNFFIPLGFEDLARWVIRQRDRF